MQVFHDYLIMIVKSKVPGRYPILDRIIYTNITSQKNVIDNDLWIW